MSPPEQQYTVAPLTQLKAALEKKKSFIDAVDGLVRTMDLMEKCDKNENFCIDFID